MSAVAVAVAVAQALVACLVVLHAGLGLSALAQRAPSGEVPAAPQRKSGPASCAPNSRR